MFGVPGEGDTSHAAVVLAGYLNKLLLCLLLCAVLLVDSGEIADTESVTWRTRRGENAAYLRGVGSALPNPGDPVARLWLLVLSDAGAIARERGGRTGKPS